MIAVEEYQDSYLRTSKTFFRVLLLSRLIVVRIRFLLLQLKTMLASCIRTCSMKSKIVSVKKIILQSSMQLRLRVLSEVITFLSLSFVFILQGFT